MNISIGKALVVAGLTVGASMISYAIGGLTNYEKGKKLGKQMGYGEALADMLNKTKEENKTIEGE